MKSMITGLFLIFCIIIVCGCIPAIATDIEVGPDPLEGHAGEPILVTVTVSNNSTPLNDTTVMINTTIGSPSVASVVTNTSGMASFSINSTLSGTGFLNLTAQNTSLATGISFSPASISSLSIDCTTSLLQVGEITNVTLIPRDRFGNVNSSGDINISVTSQDVLGYLRDSSEYILEPLNRHVRIDMDQTSIVTSNSSYSSQCLFLSLNSTASGTVHLNASIAGVTNRSDIIFDHGPASRMTVLYDDEYTVNTSSEIMVTVYDSYDNPVDDSHIYFNATAPENTSYNSPYTYDSISLTSYHELTSLSGQAFVDLRTDKRAGDNIVNISLGNTSIDLSVSIEGLADHASDILLVNTPSSAYANNEDLYRLSAQSVDRFFNPVLPFGFPIVEQILFTSSNSGSTIIPVNEYGTATTRVGPTPYVENISITASYRNESGYTNISNTVLLDFTAGPLSHFNIYANPDKVLAHNLSGNHNSTLSLVAMDEWGHALPDILVELNNTNKVSGTLFVPYQNATDLFNVSTDANGRLKAYFTSNDTAGNCTIYVSNGSVIDSELIEVKDEPFLCAYIDAEPENVNSGDLVNVTTVISIEGELPVSRDAATAMLVLDRSGSMDPDYYAGTPLDVVLVLDRSGSMEFLGSSPQQPMTDAKTAAKVFMNNLASNSRVGIVSFASSSSVDQPLTLLNSYDERESIRDAIDDIDATGGTALGDGMADANSMLINGRSGARKVMIVLTDGVCNAGLDQDGNIAISTANANGISIYTIGLGSSEYIDEPMLERIASETQAGYFNAPTSSDLQEVYNAIAQDISDFDISTVSYGTDGFTPYNYAYSASFDSNNSSTPYILSYDAWDIDSTDEDCFIYVNGVYFDEIPPTGNWNWGSFEHDITSLVQDGTNTISFYDSRDWINSVRNVVISGNNTSLASYPDEVNLVESSTYDCIFNTTYCGFEENFLINESLNDLKVDLIWSNSSADLNLKLISPSGVEYSRNSNSTGYYSDEREAVDIDVRSPVYDTYIISTNPHNTFEDDTSIYVSNGINDADDSACSIMEWQLPEAPSHNATIEEVNLYLRGMEEGYSGWDATSDNREILVYDLLRVYDSPSWNSSNSSSNWTAGNFSALDYNNSYMVDSVSLSSSVEGDIVTFDLGSALWGEDRTPDWEDSCNIVLVGSGYDGSDANPSCDRFASSETDTEAHHDTLNGWRPLITIKYSLEGDTNEYIWIQPLSYEYPDSDSVEQGNWTVRVTGDGGNESFDINTYIDRKSATRLASGAFISSFDESRGDRAGLVLYSEGDVVNSSSQEGYLRNESSWLGHFTVDQDGVYSFNLTWNDSSDVDMVLYEGIEALNSSTGSSNPKDMSAPLFAGVDYYVELSRDSGPLNDSLFTINVTSKPLRSALCTYYDSNSAGVPRYRIWDGSSWSDEASANYVGGSIQIISMFSSETRNEVILGTVDSQYDLNIQLWDGSSWSNVEEFSRRLDSYSTRGFDIAYESLSGDAIVAYLDKNIDDGVPRYRIWDGSSWSSAADTDDSSPGSGNIHWIRMASNPLSDEIVLVSLDDSRDIRAQVWNGSSWDEAISITNDARATGYQCFDVVYEQQSGHAMVVWSDTGGDIHSRIWDGSSWSLEYDMFTFTDSHRVYWIKMAADPDSDNVIMGYSDLDKDVYVTLWNGSSWSSTTKVEENCYEYSKRIFDVNYADDNAMIVWGDSSTTPKYRVWNGSWGPETSASDLAGTGYTRWTRLLDDPDSEDMLLMTSDGSNDINAQVRDGSQWGLPSELESSSSKNYECFDMVYQWLNVSTSSAPMNWKQWHGEITSSLDTDSLSHLSNSINTMSADGLTAIDEGLYQCNNELINVSGNSTVVLMTDGLDNAGHHSILEQALRAKANNTVIHTVGFGNSESEVDPVLSEIASITGGNYYFAPNSSELEDIFVGIASELTNFTAGGPTVSMHVPKNYITNLSVATAAYQVNSSNCTTGNLTTFTSPLAPSRGNAEPNITTVGNRNELQWNLPSMGPGDKWGIWYQLKVQGAGCVPLILPTSTVNYTDVNGTNINIKISYGGLTSIGGSGADVDYVSLGDITLSQVSPNILIGDNGTVRVNVSYSDGNPAIAHALIYTNMGAFNGYENPLNLTVSGADTFYLRSLTAGNAHLRAIANNGNNTVTDDKVVVIRPKGMIMVK